MSEFDKMMFEISKLEEQPQENKNNCGCGNPFEKIGQEIICFNCGNVQFTTAIDKTQKRKMYYYNKANYFNIFLKRMQGIGNFNIKKYGAILDSIFTIPNKNITTKQIKETLRKHELSFKLLRYLPDIYYYVSQSPSRELHQSVTINLTAKYLKVVRYEKQQNIKLPSSKTYFAYQFLNELDYKHLNIFLPKSFSNINVEKYDECYKTLFNKTPLKN